MGYMPILERNTLEFTSRSPEQTRRLGMRLGSILFPQAVLCLSGDLGSGKTTFVQGLAQGWGALQTVTSPTFVLVNHYQRLDGANLFHLDAYRLQNALEAEDLDLLLMLETGNMVVEWPEKIKEALPANHLWVDMKWMADEVRHLIFRPYGQGYVTMMETFRKLAFGG